MAGGGQQIFIPAQGAAPSPALSLFSPALPLFAPAASPAPRVAGLLSPWGMPLPGPGGARSAYVLFPHGIGDKLPRGKVAPAIFSPTLPRLRHVPLNAPAPMPSAADGTAAASPGTQGASTSWLAWLGTALQRIPNAIFRGVDLFTAAIDQVAAALAKSDSPFVRLFDPLAWLVAGGGLPMMAGTRIFGGTEDGEYASHLNDIRLSEGVWRHEAIRTLARRIREREGISAPTEILRRLAQVAGIPDPSSSDWSRLATNLNAREVLQAIDEAGQPFSMSAAKANLMILSQHAFPAGSAPQIEMIRGMLREFPSSPHMTDAERRMLASEFSILQDWRQTSRSRDHRRVFHLARMGFAHELLLHFPIALREYLNRLAVQHSDHVLQFLNATPGMTGFLRGFRGRAAGSVDLSSQIAREAGYAIPGEDYTIALELRTLNQHSPDLDPQANFASGENAALFTGNHHILVRHGPGGIEVELLLPAEGYVFPLFRLVGRDAEPVLQEDARRRLIRMVDIDGMSRPFLNSAIPLEPGALYHLGPYTMRIPPKRILAGALLPAAGTFPTEAALARELRARGIAEPEIMMAIAELRQHLAGAEDGELFAIVDQGMEQRSGRIIILPRRELSPASNVILGYIRAPGKDDGKEEERAANPHAVAEQVSLPTAAPRQGSFPPTDVLSTRVSATTVAGEARANDATRGLAARRLSKKLVALGHNVTFGKGQTRTLVIGLRSRPFMIVADDPLGGHERKATPLSHLPPDAREALLDTIPHEDTALSAATRIRREVIAERTRGLAAGSDYIPFVTDWNLIPTQVKNMALGMLSDEERAAWLQIVLSQEPLTGRNPGRKN